MSLSQKSKIFDDYQKFSFGKFLKFKKKCGYCGEKIEKGEEVFRDVKVPGFIGTREKAFCCSEHANSYEKEIKGKKCGCC